MNQTSGQSLADQVEALIAGGYLPKPDLRLAIDNSPVWSFGSIAGLFEIPPNRLIDTLRANGPVHAVDQANIPSSWELFKTAHL
jgi:hypothetical protein